MRAPFLVGNAYFLFGYHDAAHLIPKVDSLVYLGTEQEIDGSSGRADRLCFQDAASYSRLGRFDAMGAGGADEAEDIEVFSFSHQDAQTTLMDLAELVSRLQRCLGSRG